MRMNHGGDWAAYEMEAGQPPLDFSANISPLGLPEGVRAAVIRSLDFADRYPDPLCRTLRQRLSETYSVPPGQIICGNGAADLIDRISRAAQPRRALITAPTFGEYIQALQSVGCRVEEFPLSAGNDFRLTEAIFPAITQGLDLLVLCEPNNPTGVTTPPELLRQIFQRCRAVHCLLMVDESFNDFLPDPQSHSMLHELNGGGLVILRSFTKFYGMAGLRLGCCFTAEQILAKKIAEIGQPWPVSSPAQAAGTVALGEIEYSSAVRRLIENQRPVLAEGFRTLGCQVIPGEANYLLFRSAVPDLAGQLKQKGILLRSCDNYTGLGPDWYRAAVRTEKENSTLLCAMKQVIAEWQNVL